MGLVARQTFYNLLSIGLAFLLGAINTLYMYPNHMGSRFQGVVIALLAYSNLIRPFISFGLQHAIIKFYSSFRTQKEKDSLLIFFNMVTNHYNYFNFIISISFFIKYN